MVASRVLKPRTEAVFGGELWSERSLEWELWTRALLVFSDPDGELPPGVRLWFGGGSGWSSGPGLAAARGSGTPKAL